MNRWKRLDLRRVDSRPGEGELVALKMFPTNTRSQWYAHERHDIGAFHTDSRDRSTKLWWRGAHGTEDPTRMKKHYDIWWCVLPDFNNGF